MNDAVSHIIRYIAYLRNQYSLYVTLHNLADRSVTQCVCIGELAEYNLHTTPYCLCMKKNTALWNTCIQKQKILCEKLRQDGALYGMCHAGVCEFVYPVNYREELLGFVCVSGYRPEEGDPLWDKAMHKLAKLSRQYSIELPTLKEMYTQLLTTKLPDRELLDTLIYPLCDMLALRIFQRREYVDLPQGSIYTSAGEQLFLRICQYIWEHHAENIDLAALCAQFNYSKSYISHLFKTRCGLTINQYVNSLRIAEAKAMLTSTDMPIQEIALSVGFNDSNYFTNVFRQSLGMSPRAWRKKGAHSVPTDAANG